jgi:hypothetical protein
MKPHEINLLRTPYRLIIESMFHQVGSLQFNYPSGFKKFNKILEAVSLRNFERIANVVNRYLNRHVELQHLTPGSCINPIILHNLYRQGNVQIGKVRKGDD